MRRRLPLVFLGLVFFVMACGVSLVLSGGCARRFAENKAAARINALLPRYLGPAEHYETRLQSDSTGALLRGRVQQVHIEGRGVRLTPTLTVAHLTLDFSEVTVDPKAGVLQSVGRATFACRITEADLNRYLVAQRPDIPALTLSLRADQVRITAKPEVLGIGAPVSVEGHLVPRSGGAYLNFEPDAARLTIVPVPGLVLDYLSRRLNPAVDLSELRVPIRVSHAEVRGGALLLSGTIASDDLLRAAGSQ